MDERVKFTDGVSLLPLLSLILNKYAKWTAKYSLDLDTPGCKPVMLRIGGQLLCLKIS